MINWTLEDWQRMFGLGLAWSAFVVSVVYIYMTWGMDDGEKPNIKNHRKNKPGCPEKYQTGETRPDSNAP